MCSLVVIYADLECPERNGPFYIFKTTGIEATNTKKYVKGLRKVYDGFIIVLPVDGRWGEDAPSVDFHKATVTSNDTVCVEAINYDYELFHHPELFEDILGDEAATYIDEARNSFKDNVDRLLTKTIIKFPTPADSEEREIQLTAKPICEEDDDVTLPFEYFDIVTNHKKIGKVTKHYVAWYLCREDKKSAKRGKEEPDEDAMLSKAQRKMKELKERRNSGMNPDETKSGG
jgi:hypothetical protein